MRRGLPCSELGRRRPTRILQGCDEKCKQSWQGTPLRGAADMANAGFQTTGAQCLLGPNQKHRNFNSSSGLPLQHRILQGKTAPRHPTKDPKTFNSVHRTLTSTERLFFHSDLFEVSLSFNSCW